MLIKDFERLAGVEVSEELYREVIEPMYYATPISQEDFVNILNKEELNTKGLSKKDFVKISKGDEIIIGRLIDIDIESGKYIVKPLNCWEKAFLLTIHDYSYEAENEQCIWE